MFYVASASLSTK